MSAKRSLQEQLIGSFREELVERLATLNAGLLALEQDPQSDQRTQLLEELFRNVHSLKGAARAAGLQPIEELVHGMEDVLGAAKRGSISLTPALFDLLYHGLDLIGRVMAGLESGQGVDAALDLPGYLVRLAEAWRGQPIEPPQIAEAGAAPAAGAQPPPPPEPLPPLGDGETIRVPTARLDDLMAQAGELLVTRLRAAQQAEDMKRLYTFVARWQRNWRRMRGALQALPRQSGNGGGAKARAFLQESEETLHTLAARLGDLAQRISEDATRLALVTGDLQDGVKRVRMLPLATLLDPFRRMLRDLAREKGVEVALDVRGADTEMDKHVLEEVKDPLMHLLRNCIDHGIESPEEREKLGKPRQGTITLRAERVDNAIVVEVADDGAGIDVEAVREAAVRRGLLSRDAAEEMDSAQVTALVFASGLSTSPIITEVSGRGIGLDVVRRNVEALQGRADVHSVPGDGVTFVLTLPLTLVSTRCLLVRAGGLVYAVPLTAVERMVTVDLRNVSVVEGREAISYRGRPLSLVRLADILVLSRPERPSANHVPDGPASEDEAPAVILSAAGQQIAFLVDELLGGQELVIKSLGKQLVRVPNVAGATILGTGQVVPILNVTDLVKSTQLAGGRQHILPSVQRKKIREERKNILVVDDSITTRTLEKNILTTAGYEVTLATDGEEALAALVDNLCDLIVADIDMPRLDGFELTRRVKQDERYHDLPVILVTSLESPEDKARGIQVGADAYIIKSTFDQDALLETIRQLI